MRSKLFLIVFLGCLECFAASAFAQSKQMPVFSFQDVDGNTFTDKDVPDNSPLLLVYFRTDCNECRHVAQVIKNNAAQYPLMIWMVSPNKSDDLDVFEFMMGLSKLKNVQILQDDQHLMHRLFSFSALPFIVLYDKNGKEINRFDYLPDAATVIKSLEKE